MKKILYCKYNQNRSPKFQTKTVICQSETEKYIEKEALCEEASEHIEAFQENYEKVKDIYPAIEFIPCEIDGTTIRYPFVTGKTIDEFLKENVTNWEELFAQMRTLLEKLYKVNPEKCCDFKMTEGFKERFGDVDCAGDICIQPCNLDMIFDNLTITEEDKIKAFDYEWVCDFPVPEKYIIYRLLCRFYDKYLAYISPKYSFEQYIEKFDFNKEEQKKYRQMEDNFIQYIYKGGEPAFQAEQYSLKRTTFEELSIMQNNYKNMETGLEHAVEDYNKAMDVLHTTEKEYLTTIDRLNEAVKIKEEVEEVLHKTEQEYLTTIGRLNETVKVKEEVEEVLHKTEEEYLTTIDRLNETAEQLNLVTSSLSWKVTKPLRGTKKGLRSLKNDGVVKTIKKAGKRLKGTSAEMSGEAKASEVVLEKNKFLLEVEVSEETLKEQRDKKFEKEPKISIITPLFNTPEEFLVELIESVKNQTYQNWEFCMINFSNTDFERVDRICKEYAQEDARIVYRIESENKGISENTNVCIDYASGEFIALLDHDDVLHPCALYEAVKAINETGCDFIYTDEIKFEGSLENLFLPNYKPDFSEDELRAHNYICHFNVYAKKLYDAVGGYRKEFDGSQDHDIVLRLTEKAEKVVHIPKILYYWRVHSNSVAQCIEAKSYATDAGAGAVTEQLVRAGEQQYAESVINHIPLYRIRTEAEVNPDVTVIIWGVRDEEQLRKTKEGLGELSGCECIVLEADEEEYAAKCNAAMKTIETKYALFLYAGLQLAGESIAKEFMIYVNRQDIATIDCKVFSDKQTIFSGGVYLSGDKEMPVKIRCMGGPEEYAGYENGMLHSRNVAAVAGLCTFVDVENWKQSEGFAADNGMCTLLEYSYRMWKKGKSNIWTPFITASGIEENAGQQYIAALGEQKKRAYDERDPYFSQQVLKLGLE